MQSITLQSVAWTLGKHHQPAGVLDRASTRARVSKRARRRKNDLSPRCPPVFVSAGHESSRCLRSSTYLQFNLHSSPNRRYIFFLIPIRARFSDGGLTLVAYLLFPFHSFLFFSVKRRILKYFRRIFLGLSFRSLSLERIRARVSALPRN